WNGVRHERVLFPRRLRRAAKGHGRRRHRTSRERTARSTNVTATPSGPRVNIMIRPRDRARAFCEQYRIEHPVLLAPMAGACPASLSIAVGQAGGMGAMGALLASPDAIRQWAAEVRAGGVNAFQLNTWIPDPAAKRDAAAEGQVRSFLAHWGPEV